MTALIAFLSANSGTFITGIMTFIVGGGAVSLYKAIKDSKVADRNAKQAGIKLPVEIDAMQVTGMETLARNLQTDNEVLRKDRDYWKDRYDDLKVEVERLSEELRSQEERNAQLRTHIDELQKIIDNAEAKSPAVQANREDLAE